MSGLIIAADMSALGEAACTLAASMGSADTPGPSGASTFGHPEADAAMGEFHGAMQRHEAALAAHAGQGAASLIGYLHAFHAAGQ